MAVRKLFHVTEISLRSNLFHEVPLQFNSGGDRFKRDYLFAGHLKR